MRYKCSIMGMSGIGGKCSSLLSLRFQLQKTSVFVVHKILLAKQYQKDHMMVEKVGSKSMYPLGQGKKLNFSSSSGSALTDTIEFWKHS